VATENLIRAATDAAMRYPRAGMIDFLTLLGTSLVGLLRSHAAREAEKAFLRHQLLILKRSAPARLKLRNADRLIFVWLYRLFPFLLGAAVIFKPETPLRWHRSGFRLYWVLFSTGQGPDPVIAIIAGDDPRERAPRQIIHQLREQRLAGVHRRVLPRKSSEKASPNSNRHQRQSAENPYASDTSNRHRRSKPDSNDGH
jgi:hypothetical protein